MVSGKILSWKNTAEDSAYQLRRFVITVHFLPCFQPLEENISPMMSIKIIFFGGETMKKCINFLETRNSGIENK